MPCDLDPGPMARARDPDFRASFRSRVAITGDGNGASSQSAVIRITSPVPV